MYAGLRGGIDSLFDEGDYLSQITSVESVFSLSTKKNISKVPVLIFMLRRDNIMLLKSQSYKEKKKAKLKTQ